MLETSEKIASQPKIRKSQQRNRRHKEESLETFELNNIITTIKNSMNGLNSRIEGTEERISELEDRTIEITQTEQQRENRLKEK